MNKSALSLLRPAVLGLGVAALLGACNIGTPAQEDPTRYYLLSDTAALSSTPSTSPTGARLGLHAIVLESYLKKREMIVRTGDNEVDFKDYRRWAEPLDSAVSRVLRASLVASAGVANVAAEPFPIDQDRDFDVAVEVRHCEGLATAGGASASFAATFEIWTAGNTPRLVARKTFVAPVAAWDGSNYDRLASLLSADISALGQEIAATLPPKG
jgi:uncharacterized lipoprotein YmbA